MEKDLQKSQDEITLDEARRARTIEHMKMVAKRRERDAHYLELSPEALEAGVLNDRIEDMVWDYEKVAYVIPSQLTFHRQDGKDNWKVTSGPYEEDNSKYLEMIRNGPNGEVERFFFKTGEKPIAIHTDNFRPELRETLNSEREIRPAEILFRRMWKPLLDHHDAPYISDRQKFDS